MFYSVFYSENFLFLTVSDTGFPPKRLTDQKSQEMLSMFTPHHCLQASHTDGIPRLLFRQLNKNVNAHCCHHTAKQAQRHWDF